MDPTGHLRAMAMSGLRPGHRLPGACTGLPAAGLAALGPARPAAA